MTFVTLLLVCMASKLYALSSVVFVVGASLQASLSVCVTSPPLPRALLCVRPPLPCGRRHNSQQVSYFLNIICDLLSCSGVRLAHDPRMFENSIQKKNAKSKVTIVALVLIGFAVNDFLNDVKTQGLSFDENY